MNLKKKIHVKKWLWVCSKKSKNSKWIPNWIPREYRQTAEWIEEPNATNEKGIQKKNKAEILEMKSTISQT